MIGNKLDLTVSIVNWNTREELRECINSVLAQKPGVRYEVNVVDNASSDGSADMIRTEFGDRVNLIESPKNLGFGAGHNLSIRQSTARYVFLLNPDCRLLVPDVLEKMVYYMDANEYVGMLGPKVLNPDGSLQYSARKFPPLLAGVFRHTILGKLFPNNRFERDYLMTDWSHDEVIDVGWLSGSALMVRRETIESIGLLDERFFMYVEDMDWCRRAHDHGWRVVYYPMTSVSHRIGAASDKNPVKMIKQHHKSMLRYFMKYNAGSPKVLLTPFVMIGLWLRMRARIKLTQPK